MQAKRLDTNQNSTYYLVLAMTYKKKKPPLCDPTTVPAMVSPSQPVLFFFIFAVGQPGPVFIKLSSRLCFL